MLKWAYFSPQFRRLPRLRTPYTPPPVIRHYKAIQYTSQRSAIQPPPPSTNAAGCAREHNVFTTSATSVTHSTTQKPPPYTPPISSLYAVARQISRTTGGEFTCRRARDFKMPVEWVDCPFQLERTAMADRGCPLFPWRVWPHPAGGSYRSQRATAAFPSCLAARRPRVLVPRPRSRAPSYWPRFVATPAHCNKKWQTNTAEYVGSFFLRSQAGKKTDCL